jgi:hypothetical protein
MTGEKTGRTPPKLWVQGLIVLVSFYLALMIAITVLNLVATQTLILYSVIGGLALVVGCISHKRFRKKQIAYFSITLSVIGIVLILLASIALVPYTTWETFRKDRVQDWTPYFHSASSSDSPTYENGSLRIITIPPLSTKTYKWETTMLWENISIVQTDISTSGPLSFTIAKVNADYTVAEVYFNQTMGGYGSGGNPGSSWVTYCWTPPYLVYNVGFVFENPVDQETLLCFRVTEYNLKATDERRITQYRTLIDSNFTYIGVSLITATVILDAYSYNKQRKRLVSLSKP